MFVDILNAMKRFSVLLFIIAVSSAAALAQSIEIEGHLCIGDTLKFKFTNLPGRYDSFSWNFGDGSTSTDKEATHSFSEDGTYTIKFSSKSSGADEITGSKSITINAVPGVDFSVDTAGQRNTCIFKVVITSEEYTYEWHFGDGSKTTTTENQVEHSYSAPGVYTADLLTTDSQGCSSSASKSVKIEASSKLPNVFTPNGDGLNDYFMISCSEGSRLKLEIFNRWGYKMFSRTGTENIVWDGYNPQGTLVSPGTYFYVITVEEGTTNYNPLNGYITVYY